ncbi:MAG: radical SAM protein [Promethearchaeota archaeon]|nr:MAG: radical SAM protein [Candidatus Lokiarchaeota archaeon]
MVTENDVKDIYLQKVDLLLSGLRITQKFLDTIKQYSDVEWQRGRKGGAGPAGGRYFLFKNGSVVNAGLWGSQSEQSHLLLEDVRGYSTINPSNLIVTVRNSKINQIFEVELIPTPEKYNSGENLSGTVNKQIALVHGTTCLASTIVQKCRYWGEKKACAFCGIEFSLDDKTTIEKKSSEQLLHAISGATAQGLCDHMTLTMGTLSLEDKGAEKYIEIVLSIKKQYPNLPIHIQIEPFEDISKLMELKKAGVDTIGIHLEIPNDLLREKNCPGKFETPRSAYEEFWKKSVDIFGRTQVSTFILVGFGEPLEELIEYCDKLIEIGVVPNVMPVRHIVGTNLDYHPISYDDLVLLYDSIAFSFLKHNMDPRTNKAGCIRCMGCSAIIDAFDYHKNAHHNN